MSKKLVVGAVAMAMALTPAAAKAGPKGSGSVVDPCFGLGAQYGNTCQGHTYKYVCIPPFYPKQLAMFTDSDATEDQYEAYIGWRCRGD
jgi:hypothetical protein